MARPPTIDDQTILEAARAVFLERGAMGTTAEVAARAGVSEGSIFNRFKTKEALFRAAMHPAVGADLPAALVHRVGRGEMREQLLEVAADFLAYFEKLVPFIMMQAGSPGFSPPRTEDGKHPATRGLRAVMGWLEAEMRLGRLRRHDPEIVARSFVGALFHHAFLESMTSVKDDLPLPRETFLRGVVAMLWSGLDPQRPASSGIRKNEPKSKRRRWVRMPT